MHTSDEPSTGATRPTPVFLDATGRRLRRARLVGGSVIAAGVAYVVLLLSAALGGPSIDAPFLPRPAAPTRGLAALPSATPMTDPQGAAGAGAGAAGAVGSPGQATALRGFARSRGAAMAAATVPGASAGPSSPSASSATTPAVSPVPVATTGTPVPSATTPVATPTMTPTHTGRSASAPGHTVRPTVSRTR